MDVNDLGSPKLPTELVKETQSSRSNITSEKSASAINQSADISVELSDNGQVPSSDLRGKANEIINLVNVTSTATEQIETLVHSISGIVEQAKSPDLSDNKRLILQNEANQLVEEIKTKAYSTESSGLRPLLGDNIRFEVEQKYGDALEIILPDTAKNAFGLGQINLSLKDSIIDTIARVEQAKKQFEALRTSVDEVSNSVRKSVDTLEVALQNNEAAKATIRTVDQALTVASSTHTLISSNREEALGSFSKLDLNSTTLLRS